jgi:hypothetical protein
MLSIRTADRANLCIMADRKTPDEPQVLRYRYRRSDELAGPSDLSDYEHADEPDDYRHRMVMNTAALAVVALLILAGLWIANTMATMRKNQDCVLSGRRGCTPVEVEHQRW